MTYDARCTSVVNVLLGDDDEDYVEGTGVMSGSWSNSPVNQPQKRTVTKRKSRCVNLDATPVTNKKSGDDDETIAGAGTISVSWTDSPVNQDKKRSVTKRKPCESPSLKKALQRFETDGFSGDPYTIEGPNGPIAPPCDHFPVDPADPESVARRMEACKTQVPASS